MPILLKKAVIEVRFTEALETLKYSEVFNELYNLLKKDFTTSNFDYGSQSFVMQNPLQNQSCVISQLNIVIAQEIATNIDVFNKLIEKTLDAIRDKKIINGMSRIGYRTFWGIDYNSLEEVDKALCVGFKINKDSFNCFGDSSGVKFGFSTREKEYGLNYNFAPAINKEIKINNGNILSEKDIYCLLSDIDIFVDQDCKYSNLFKHTNDFRNLTKEKSSMIEKIIEGGQQCL